MLNLNHVFGKFIKFKGNVYVLLVKVCHVTTNFIDFESELVKKQLKEIWAIFTR